jgi:hypothetical protein
MPKAAKSKSSKKGHASANTTIWRTDWNQLSKPQSNNANSQSRNHHKKGGKAQ